MAVVEAGCAAMAGQRFGSGQGPAQRASGALTLRCSPHGRRRAQECMGVGTLHEGAPVAQLEAVEVVMEGCFVETDVLDLVLYSSQSPIPVRPALYQVPLEESLV